MFALARQITSLSACCTNSYTVCLRHQLRHHQLNIISAVDMLRADVCASSSCLPTHFEIKSAYRQCDLQVTQKSAILLVHFQPTFCFFVWYCLRDMCPQSPSGKHRQEEYDPKPAANFAIHWATQLAHPLALAALMDMRPDDLLPESCLPLTEFALKQQQQSQTHTGFLMYMLFIQGLHQPEVGKVVDARFDQCTSAKQPFLLALLLVEQLLLHMQPLVRDRPETMLLEVVHCILDLAPSSLHSPTDPLDHPPSGTLPDNCSEEQTDQLLQAVVQSSLQLLQPLTERTPGQLPHNTVWLLVTTVVPVLMVALRWARSGDLWQDFCKQGVGFCLYMNNAHTYDMPLHRVAQTSVQIAEPSVVLDALSCMTGLQFFHVVTGCKVTTFHGKFLVTGRLGTITSS